MDFLTILIGFGLVLTGAAFVGYPVGTIIGARRARKEFAVKTVLQKRFHKKDVLDDEIVTESDSWDEFISQFPEVK